MPRKASKQIVSEQSKLFIQKARELGCSEDEKAFDKALKKLSSAPTPNPKSRKSTKVPRK